MRLVDFWKPGRHLGFVALLILLGMQASPAHAQWTADDVTLENASPDNKSQLLGSGGSGTVTINATFNGAGNQVTLYAEGSRGSNGIPFSGTQSIAYIQYDVVRRYVKTGTPPPLTVVCQISGSVSCTTHLIGSGWATGDSEAKIWGLNMTSINPKLSATPPSPNPTPYSTSSSAGVAISGTTTLRATAMAKGHATAVIYSANSLATGTYNTTATVTFSDP